MARAAAVPAWHRVASLRSLRSAGFGILAMVLIAPLGFLGDYQLFRLTLIATYALALLGLNLVMGFGGQISLGHGAFYASGAYTTAILMTSAGVPYWATLPCAGAAGAALGFLVGWPALRLRGHYLALITLALATAIPQALKCKALEPWTGGVQGVIIDKPGAPFGLPLSPDGWLYLLALAITAVAFTLVANLLRGRIGRAIVAVRDHTLAAEAMGVHVARLKTRTFALSAALTALAGSLGALETEFVSPDSFTVFLSITLFVGSVVGGVASIGGAVAGAVFIVMVPPLANSVSRAAPGAVYGVILIACLYLMPSGIAGLLRRAAASSWWRKRKRGGEHVA
ncbi:MAG: branched-chain amino acid ABC transporter permease [Acetobacteraceae bacterium]|nr:branched-chain amino acid ABC transporter permease [Acetobacteraceae bacterium]